MELVTGRKGVAHITSQQDRMKHQGMFGDGAYILKTGQMLEPQVQTSNEIRIRDGALMVQGALSCVKTNSYDTVTIQNGTQGMKRIDLICWQYTHDAEQDVESAEWVVIQGTPAESDPQQPSYTDGDIQQGDSPVQVPVFAVELDGINVTGVTTLLPTAPTLEELNGKMTEVGSQQSYSENGWSVSYRSIGANRVYFITSKTVSSIVTGGNQLEIAALPFKVAFEQHIYLAMNVSGTPVGYGYTRIVPTSGSGNTSAMYRHCTGYSNAVTMLAFGELVIQ